MSLLKIARMGHPVLLARAEPVADPAAPEIRQLAADMIETMDDAPGIGLAGPQVHVPLRLFVMRLPAARNEGEEIGPVVLINPSYEPVGEAMIQSREGCLSIPGLSALVPRHARIRYSGVDCEGQPVSGEASGLLAVVIQHEYDHLDGILYPMRITDWASFVYVEELGRSAAR